MQSYVKPMMRVLEEDAGSCGCNFHYNETPSDCRQAVLPGTVGAVSGPCVSVTGQPGPGSGEVNLAAIQKNTIVGVRDGSIAVTPFANTGLPASQPIDFGIPVGTRGLYLDVNLASGVTVGQTGALGASVAGRTILLP